MFFKYIYKGYGRKKQLNFYRQKEVLDDFNNPKTILVPRPNMSINVEDIDFLVVFSNEIERLKDHKEEDEMKILQNQMIEMVMSPEFLENRLLT
jgi:hypothetical protein